MDKKKVIKVEASAIVIYRETTDFTRHFIDGDGVSPLVSGEIDPYKVMEDVEWLGGGYPLSDSEWLEDRDYVITITYDDGSSVKYKNTGPTSQNEDDWVVGV